MSYYPNEPVPTNNLSKYLRSIRNAGKSNAINGSGDFESEQSGNGTNINIPSQTFDQIIYRGDFDPDKSYNSKDQVRLTSSYAYSYTDPISGQVHIGQAEQGLWQAVAKVPKKYSTAELNTLNSSAYSNRVARLIRRSGICYSPISPEPEYTASTDGGQGKYWVRVSGGGSSPTGSMTYRGEWSSANSGSYTPYQFVDILNKGYFVCVRDTRNYVGESGSFYLNPENGIFWHQIYQGAERFN